MANLDLHPVSSPSSSAKPPPPLASLSPPPVFAYTPSPDGLDHNLLILFHGLGDTCRPFASLGRSLNLAQTATLAIQAPERIPLLDEDCWQWWDSFDQFGEPVPHPNPTKTLSYLTALVDLLTSPLVGWSPPQIHLFGFAQGGTCAAELALSWSRAHPTPGQELGTVVTVSGPLLSFPNTRDRKVATKVLLVYRTGEERAMGGAVFKKGFDTVTEVPMGKGEGMPRSKVEWEPIMRFWSENLRRSSALERGEGVYEIRGGIAAAQDAGATA